MQANDVILIVKTTENFSAMWKSKCCVSTLIDVNVSSKPFNVESA
jgi:hypothetical protein